MVNDCRSHFSLDAITIYGRLKNVGIQRVRRRYHCDTNIIHRRYFSSSHNPWGGLPDGPKNVCVRGCCDTVAMHSNATLRYFSRDRAERKLQPVNKRRQEKIRGRRGRLQVQALGYSNSTKVILGVILSLERKSVFRDVRSKANLGLML